MGVEKPTDCSRSHVGSARPSSLSPDISGDPNSALGDREGDITDKHGYICHKYELKHLPKKMGGHIIIIIVF